MVKSNTMTACMTFAVGAKVHNRTSLAIDQDGSLRALSAMFFWQDS